MPDWKHEIRQRLANLQLEPTREAAIVEEIAQYLDDCYAELLAGGATEEEAWRQTLTELDDSELLTQEPSVPISLETLSSNSLMSRAKEMFNVSRLIIIIEARESVTCQG